MLPPCSTPCTAVEDVGTVRSTASPPALAHAVCSVVAVVTEPIIKRPRLWNLFLPPLTTSARVRCVRCVRCGQLPPPQLQLGDVGTLVHVRARCLRRRDGELTAARPMRRHVPGPVLLALRTCGAGADTLEPATLGSADSRQLQLRVRGEPKEVGELWTAVMREVLSASQQSSGPLVRTSLAWHDGAHASKTQALRSPRGNIRRIPTHRLMSLVWTFLARRIKT